MSDGSIVILGCAADTTNVVYNALASEFRIARVIVEQPVPRKAFLKARLKRLGMRKVAGQLVFVAVAPPLLRRVSKKRLAQIDRELGMDRTPPPAALVTLVESANDETTIDTLRALAPVAVVLHGTRILSKKLLAAVSCPIINMHAGITPLFRGVHGGYWALAHGDREHCGVTVHLVDSGIDTGGILYQAPIAPTADDNFVTYPELQLGVGLDLLRRAVRDATAGKLSVVASPAGDSRLWTHPTLAEYLWYRAVKGVR